MSCKGFCPDCPIRWAKPVHGGGNRNAKIALVGEGPGRDEVREGVPFIGRSGRLLDFLLKQAEIDRDKLYITNATLCYPKVITEDHEHLGADFESILKKLKHISMKSCQSRLYDELYEVKPDVVVGLGSVAMRSLLGVPEGILKMRGSVHRINIKDHQCWFTSTLHPAYLLRGQEHLSWVATQDLIKARKLSEGIRPREEDLIIVEKHSPEIFARACATLQSWIDRKATVAIDVETTGPSAIEDKLRTIAIAAIDDNKAVVFPVMGVLLRHHESALLALTKEICANESVEKVFQNLGFDCTALEQAGMPVKGKVHDTLVMHHVGEPEQPHGLGWQAQTYLMVSAWKTEERRNEKRGVATLRSLMSYNAKDALYTGWIVEPLREAVDLSHGALAVEKETEWAHLARQMSIVGVPVNEATMNRFANDLIASRDQAMAEIQAELKWPDLDLHKPSHRVEFLYERLALPVRKYTEKKQEPSTSYKAVIDFLHEPLVAKYVEWVDKAHQYSTFIKGYRKRLSPDWRLRVSWNPTGTVGSRWSSTPNLQNVPKDLREMFEPKPGRIFVGADYAALEFRILACFAGCNGLLNPIKAGEDIHSLNASRILEDYWAKLPPKGKQTMRTLVKRVVYGLNYGAEAPKLTASLREDRKTSVELRKLITLPRVQEIRKGFFEIYPEIQEYQQHQVELANTQTFIEVPPLNRRRYFGALPVRPTKAYNFRIQTAAGDIMNLALLKLSKMIPTSADILINGHDAVVVECNEDDAEKIAKMVEEAMFFPLSEGSYHVDLIADADIGRTWKDV